MALVALNNCVRAEQRKPVEVILNRLIRDLPAKHRMAFGAVGAKLPAVNIGVAIGAILANFGEDGFCMATRAGHFFVHAAQRISRGIVIEFGNGANRGPAGVGVAILAGNRQGTVRTPFGLLLCGRHSGSRENQKK